MYCSEQVGQLSVKAGAGDEIMPSKCIFVCPMDSDFHDAWETSKGRLPLPVHDGCMQVQLEDATYGICLTFKGDAVQISEQEEVEGKAW